MKEKVTEGSKEEEEEEEEKEEEEEEKEEEEKEEEEEDSDYDYDYENEQKNKRRRAERQKKTNDEATLNYCIPPPTHPPSLSWPAGSRCVRPSITATRSSFCLRLRLANLLLARFAAVSASSIFRLSCCQR